MIFGRPTNLWLGAFTAIFNATVLILAALVPPIVIPAVVVGGVNLAIAAVIALVAGQPPTLNPGDRYTVVTPPDETNVTKVANTNMAPTPPPAV